MPVGIGYPDNVEKKKKEKKRCVCRVDNSAQVRVEEELLVRNFGAAARRASALVRKLGKAGKIQAKRAGLRAKSRIQSNPNLAAGIAGTAVGVGVLKHQSSRKKKIEGYKKELTKRGLI